MLFAARLMGPVATTVHDITELKQTEEAQRLGAGTYLKKPYTLDRVAVAVRRELNREYREG